MVAHCLDIAYLSPHTMFIFDLNLKPTDLWDPGTIMAPNLSSVEEKQQILDIRDAARGIN